MFASPQDIDRIMAVMDAGFDPAFGEAWSRRQVADAFLAGNCHFALIAQCGSTVPEGEPAVGFHLARQIVDDLELLLLAVDPAFRQQGFGTGLLTILAEQGRQVGARRIFLEMRRGNPAEHLYRKFGFKPVGMRPKYYKLKDGSRIDAVTFAMQIAD